MRKFMKVSAITAGIMIFLGIGLFTVGGCGGGFSETVQKIVNGDFNFTDEDLKNIIGNYVSSNDSLEITVNEENKYLPDFPVVTDTESYERDFDTAEFSSMVLQLGGCEVKILSSDDENVHIKAEKVKKIQTGVKDNTLYITSTDRKGVTSGNWTKITIQIPEAFCYDTVDIDLGAGDFSIESLTVKM